MVAVFVVVVVASGFALAVSRTPKTGDFNRRITSSVIVITVIVCIYHMEYDCLVLFFPFLIFLKYLNNGIRLLWFPIGALTFVLFNPLMTKTVQRVFDFSETAMRTAGAMDAFVISSILVWCIFWMVKSSLLMEKHD